MNQTAETIEQTTTWAEQRERRADQYIDVEDLHYHKDGNNFGSVGIWRNNKGAVLSLTYEEGPVRVRLTPQEARKIARALTAAVKGMYPFDE